MQDSEEYGGANQPEEIGGEKGAAEQLEQILAIGLPPLSRVAYRILATQQMRRTRFRTPFSQPIPAWTNLEDRRRSPPG